MTDKQIIRELAKKYMEQATSEKQLAANKRMQDTNDLKLVRPPVMLNEIPWYQMDIDGDLVCLCRDPRAREVEGHLRRYLYMCKYFRADNILEPYFRVNRHFEVTPSGWEVREDIRRTDDENHIISHHYIDVLETEEAVEAFRMPEFSLDPEKDEEAVNYYSDLLGDAMPVKLCGMNYLYFMPWDLIVRLRGMEPILFDFYDRPEHLHAIMEKMCTAKQAELEAREYEVSAGGGAVTVKINGQKQILSLDIAPEIVDPDDIETLSDILVAAVNEAIKRVEDTASSEMEAITGSMNLPGMGGFPGLF